MDKKELREDAKTYFVPIILGSNSKAHALSSKIFRKYKISPVVADTKRSFWSFTDPFSSFLPLASKNSELVLEQLSAFVCGESYILPILIPCSDEYEALIENIKPQLERVFIICTADGVFTSSPMSIIN